MMKNMKLLLFLLFLQSVIHFSFSQNEYKTIDDSNNDDNNDDQGANSTPTTNIAPYFLKKDMPKIVGKPAGSTVVALKCNSGDNQTNRTFMEGEMINIVCRGPSSDVKNITYTWYKDGKNLADSKSAKISKQWLKFKSIKKRDNGTYYCNVKWNESDTVESFWYNITINVQPRIYREKQNTSKPVLQIMSHKTEDKVEDHRERRFLPESHTSINHVVKFLNGNVTLSCPHSKSKANITIKWFKNASEEKKFQNKANFTLNHLTKEDEGIYKCEIKSPSNNHDHHIVYKLHVFNTADDMPIIIEGPTNTTVSNGQDASFTCVVSHPKDHVIWRYSTKNSSSIDIGEITSLSSDSDPRKLIIRNAHENNTGWYTCIVSRDKSIIKTSSAWLEVDSIENDNGAIDDSNDDDNNEDQENDSTPTTNGAPYFLKKDMPKTVEKPAGSTVALKCNSGGNPRLNVTWLKEGFPPTRSLGIVKYRKWCLTMEDLTPSDSGNYTCVVCNTIGCINHTFYVEVAERYPSPPVIVNGYPKNVTVLVNTSAILECPTVSDNEPFITWSKLYNAPDSEENPPKGQLLQTSRNDDIVNSEIFELNNVTHADAGWYTCAAANGLGIAYGNAYLHVIDHLQVTDSKENFNLMVKKKILENNTSTTVPSVILIFLPVVAAVSKNFFLPLIYK